MRECLLLLISVKTCGNSFCRLADLAPYLRRLRLYPPTAEAPCVPIGQLPVLLNFSRLSSAYVYFKGQVGGGHRNPHYIEHFLKETFFDLLPSAFPLLRAVDPAANKDSLRESDHIELTMRPVGASVDNVLTLVIYRSAMGEVMHYWG